MVAHDGKEWTLVAIVVFLGLIVGGVLTYYASSTLGMS